ncbi:hypothetical protein ACPPVQ_15930 [Diaminobutyricibacter sp. McL0618]|uniref:hypothetical protein n=1 Tax=Leifsonia sp. McL0618 TaxID=3415677 RepID=UPI003CF70751
MSDEVIPIETYGVLLGPESTEDLRNLGQPFEGVGARAPSGLEIRQRVGGVPLCGFAFALFSVTNRS